VRFEVEPRDRRPFVVDAGDVRVKVVGTAFSVDRTGDVVHVDVQEGVVRVEWPGGAERLEAGEQGRYPKARPTQEPTPTIEAPSTSPEEPAAAPVTAPGPKTESPAAKPTRRTRKRSWQRLARAGRFTEARQEMKRAGAGSVRDRTEELLLAADVARLSGHPREAVPPLERVLARHESDPRAPLAAFTLGRLYLEELGQPTEAAASFARVPLLDPRGELLEAAWALEVEALSRAGNVERARVRAEAFLEAYPSSPRSRLVRRWGGLE
jgi:transmembrane sensor